MNEQVKVNPHTHRNGHTVTVAATSLQLSSVINSIIDPDKHILHKHGMTL